MPFGVVNAKKDEGVVVGTKDTLYRNILIANFVLEGHFLDLPHSALANILYNNESE